MSTESAPFAGVALPESGSMESQQPVSDSIDTQSPASHRDMPEIDKFERFKYQGQEWTPKDLEKAILRQKDYTQKTQAAAEERKTVEQARKEFEQEQKYFHNLNADLRIIANNPDKRDTLIAEFVKIYPQKFHADLKYLLQNLNEGKSPQQNTHRQTPDIDLMNRINTLEKFYHDQEIAKNKSSIDNNISKLSSQYPDAIPELVIGRVFEAYNQMLENNPNAQLTDKSWEDTFKSVDQEMKELVAKRYGDKVKKQTQANAKAKSPDAGGGTIGRAPQKAKGFKEATAHALRDLTGKG